MQSPVHRLYTCFLNTYSANQAAGKHPFRNRAFETAVRIGAKFLSAWKRFSFPERNTGGWWWLWRFRFEFLAGWYEKECIDWCKNLILPGMTVVDVGAHLGYYSRLFSKLVGPHGRVLAFEANPDNFEVLRKNLRGYPNVQLWNRCVTDRNGVFPLHISPGHSNHSLLAGYTESRGILNVEGIALDSFFASHQITEVGFIKSDTEGAEPMVLAGMTTTACRDPRPTLLLEFNPTALQHGATKPEEFVAQLRLLGFDVQAIAADGSLAEISDSHGWESRNLLCRPLPRNCAGE